MNRIAVFSDLHGNLQALQTILDKIYKLDCISIYCLGDSISIGPSSNECLDIFRSNGINAIIGNHEEYLLKSINEPLPSYMSQGEYKHQLFVHRQISDINKEFVCTWKYRIDEVFDNLKSTFIHSPYSINEPYYDFININHMNLDQVEDAFLNYESEIILFGHTHTFFDFIGNKRYINPGSVGCHKKNYALFSIIEFNSGIINVQHYQELYNKAELINDFDKKQIPERDIIKKIFF